MQILIVTYAKDIPWLEWCVKSIKKFCTGFSGITIVHPGNEVLPHWPNIEYRTYNRTPDKRKWHLHAQCQKCFADEFCPNADYILHTDSDCIFTEPITPADYMENGKPVMLIEDYNRLKDSVWKETTEDVLARHVQYETMRRHPQVNPRGLYYDFRHYIEEIHWMPFEQFVLSRKPDFPWGFSEHNALGAYALSNPRWEKEYYWIKVGEQPTPKEKLKQFWSLGPIDKPQGTPHDHDTVTPLDICRRIVGQ